MMPKRNCEYCGMEYQPKHSQQKYCTPQCKIEASRKRLPMTEHRCTWCGRKYMHPTGQKRRIGDTTAYYCSSKCREEAIVEVEPKCIICGGKLPKGRKKYCSKDCSDLYWNKKQVTKTSMSLNQAAKAARDAGLTYGQWMVQHG